MRKTYGTIGFFIAAMVTFRLVYGAWPPFHGSFGDWLASDSRAIIWAIVAGLAGGVVGTIVGQAIGVALDKDRAP